MGALARLGTADLSRGERWGEEMERVGVAGGGGGRGRMGEC